MRATRLAVAVAVAVAVLAAMWCAVPAAADEVRDAQWHLDALEVAEAHRHSLGDGVTVAVLDSGVDASHPDLRGSVLPGVDVTGGGSDGRDDPVGSGTALAGLIAGQGHGEPAPTAEDEDGSGVPVPADGVLGLAPAAAILPVVVAAPGAAPDGETLAAGIDAAVRGGAGVICIGRPPPDHPDLRRELGAAVAAGVLVVVPAASTGDPLARYGGAGLLGAVPAGPDPLPAAGAATGAVVVPAVGVMSAGGQGGYYRYARTSEAAASAVLAGAAALVRAEYPDLSGAQAAYRIEQSSEGGPDGGVLDLAAALTADLPPAPAPPAAPPPASDPAPPPTVPDPGGPAPVPEPGPEDWVAAFDSGDWRRWLVATPLVLFLMVLVAVSVAGARRARNRVSRNRVSRNRVRR